MAAAWAVLGLTACSSEPAPAPAPVPEPRAETPVAAVAPEPSVCPEPVVVAAAPAPSSDPEPVLLAGEETVVAIVNGDPITGYEVDTAVNRMLGRSQRALLDEAGRDKVVQSLVASRAIAQRQAARMSPEALAALDKQAADYREQLLVKAYLAEMAAPRPVTEAMVREYYETHPELFGARVIRDYEMIVVTADARGDERRRLASALERAAQDPDWEASAHSLAGAGFPVRHRRGQVDPKVLAPGLRDVLAGLGPGEVSPVSLLQGRPYVVRVASERRVPPKPLAEVSGQIRKMLLPTQLSQAVKSIAGDVMAEAEVEYPQRAGNR